MFFFHDEVKIKDCYGVLGSVIISDIAEQKVVERSLKQRKTLIKNWLFMSMFHFKELLNCPLHQLSIN